MKKIYYCSLLVTALALAGCEKDKDGNNGTDGRGEDAAPTIKIETISFEACEFEKGKTNNKATGTDPVTYTEFGADFSHLDYYTMLGGVVISSDSDSSEDGDSESSHTDVNGNKTAEKHGADGTAKFAAFLYNSSVADYGMSFAFSDKKEHKIVSAFVNNSAYMYQKMKYGFYDEKGLAAGDYCEITFTGYDAAGKETGKTKFALGDFRDGKKDICSEWIKVDLSALGTVNKVVITTDIHIATDVLKEYKGYSVCIDEISFELPLE